MRKARVGDGRGMRRASGSWRWRSASAAPPRRRVPTTSPPRSRRRPPRSSRTRAFAIGFAGDVTTLPDGEGYIAARIRPGTQTPCAATDLADPGDGVVIGAGRLLGAFSVAGSYTADEPGTYLVCAWITAQGDESGPPASATVIVRPPVLRLAGTAPERVSPGEPFDVTVDYDAEVSRYLTGVVFRGTRCPIQIHNLGALVGAAGGRRRRQRRSDRPGVGDPHASGSRGPARTRCAATSTSRSSAASGRIWSSRRRRSPSSRRFAAAAASAAAGRSTASARAACRASLRGGWRAAGARHAARRGGSARTAASRARAA